MPCINVSSAAVADDDLRLVEQLEAGQQEGQGDEGQGGSQDGRPRGLLDAKESNHDDLEEHGGCDDVLEDLHPHLQHRRAAWVKHLRLYCLVCGRKGC